jgi:hypothetical protein
MINKRYTASLLTVFIVIFMISSNFSRSQSLSFPYIIENVYADESSTDNPPASNINTDNPGSSNTENSANIGQLTNECADDKSMSCLDYYNACLKQHLYDPPSSPYYGLLNYVHRCTIEALQRSGQQNTDNPGISNSEQNSTSNPSTTPASSNVSSPSSNASLWHPPMVLPTNSNNNESNPNNPAPSSQTCDPSTASCNPPSGGGAPSQASTGSQVPSSPTSQEPPYPTYGPGPGTGGPLDRVPDENTPGNAAPVDRVPLENSPGIRVGTNLAYNYDDPSVVNALKQVGEEYHNDHPNSQPIQLMDMSILSGKGGGGGHNGFATDVHPMSTDSNIAATYNSPNYDRQATIDVIQKLRDNSLQSTDFKQKIGYILFDDPEVVAHFQGTPGPPVSLSKPYTDKDGVYHPNKHDNHFHVEFCNPNAHTPGYWNSGRPSCPY